MHQVSYNIMVNLLMKYPHTAGRVLDVGSYNVNGTYKPMFGSGYKADANYIGDCWGVGRK